MDPISLALGLAQFVPSIVRWIGGDDAGDKAEQIVGVAKRVAGGADDPAAAIKADPALYAQFQQAMAQLELSFYTAETARLDSVNATMRAEAASGSVFQSSWRPMFGYVAALAFGAQMLGLTYLILAEPTKAAPVIQALGDLTVLWGVALSVLGIQVASRTQEKLTALTGEKPTGLMGAVAQRIAGR